MRKSFYSLALMIVLVLGTTLAAKADSQSFNVAGANGVQTLTVNMNNAWVFNYSLTLNGGSGLYSGVEAWFVSDKLMTMQFTDIVKGVSYLETFTAQWNGLWWNVGNTYSESRVQTPEESALFELFAVGLALVLVLPLATKLRRPAQS